MSMFGEQRKNPLKGRQIPVTFMCLAATLLAFLGVFVYVHYTVSARIDDAMPQLALNGFMRDLNTYYQQKRQYPVDLTQLAEDVWQKRNAGSEKIVFPNGKNIVLSQNYLYLYRSDLRSGDNQTNPVCAVWAIPQGAYRDQFNTVYLVISPQKYEEWRGGALKYEEYSLIPVQTIPTVEQMTRLGMTKKINDGVTPLKKRRTIF